MDILTAIAGRASPRLIEPGPSPAELDQLLRAGVRAPDHGLLAPWRFIPIAGPDRSHLGEALAGLRRARQHDAAPAALDSERAKAFRAPLILAVAAEPRPHPKVPEIEQVMAVSACTQNIILAAAALGYAAIWKTGPAAYDPDVKRLLGLTDQAAIVAFLYIGTPAEARPARPAVIEGLVRPLSPPPA